MIIAFIREKVMATGVDITLGDRCSRQAYDWAQRTHSLRDGRAGSIPDGFSGSFANLIQFGDQRIAIGSDGIGTKIDIAERTQCYHTLGYDLVAMVADDLVCIGAEPTNLTNVLDADNLNSDIIQDLMRGLHDAAAVAGVALTGGETAELGDRVSGYGDGMHFNWSATCLGVIPDENEPIDGASIEAGDTIVALRSHGFRSNGFTLARSILSEQYGSSWHLKRPDLAQALLRPSRIYCPLITTALHQHMPLHGIAHITGGGIAGNLPRVLSATGQGAILDNLPDPHPEMLELQEMGELDEADTYRQWNMGTGMLVVLPSSQAEAFVTLAEDMHYTALIAGTITSSPSLEIHTNGLKPAQYHHDLTRHTSTESGGSRSL